MAAGTEQSRNDGLLADLADTDSDESPFEGFGGRDTRKYTEVASKATLFRCSTPIKKARHVRRDSSSGLSFSLLSDEDVSERPHVLIPATPVGVSPVRKETSSPSSVEGEIATTSFISNPRFSASISNSTTSFDKVDSSSSSIEGEISGSYPLHHPTGEQLPLLEPDKHYRVSEAVQRAEDKSKKENITKKGTSNCM